MDDLRGDQTPLEGHRRKAKGNKGGAGNMREMTRRKRGTWIYGDIKRDEREATRGRNCGSACVEFKGEERINELDVAKRI